MLFLKKILGFKVIDLLMPYTTIFNFAWAVSIKVELREKNEAMHTNI